MKCSRFVLILIRGPPVGKGVFMGLPPRKNALLLFQGRWQNGHCTRLLTGGRTVGSSLESQPHWRAGSNPVLPAICFAYVPLVALIHGLRCQ